MNKIPLDKWVAVGICPVDSGQIMLVDPCYVLPDKARKLGNRTLKGKRGYDYMKLVNQWDYNNPDLIKRMTLNPVFSAIAGKGVVVSSGNGDGVYTVFAKFTDTGGGDIRLSKVKIEFL